MQRIKDQELANSYGLVWKANEAYHGLYEVKMFECIGQWALCDIVVGRFDLLMFFTKGVLTGWMPGHAWNDSCLVLHPGQYVYETKLEKAVTAHRTNWLYPASEFRKEILGKRQHRRWGL